VYDVMAHAVDQPVCCQHQRPFLAGNPMVVDLWSRCNVALQRPVGKACHTQYTTHAIP
jgi:hypothetical protein